MPFNQEKIQQYLKKLSYILKKRQEKEAYQKIRVRLMKKAKEMEKRKPQVSEKQSFINALTPMWKKLVPAIAAILVVIIAVFTFNPGGNIAPTLTLIDIAHAKDFYTLTPEKNDHAGIDPSTSFVLASKESIDSDTVQEMLEIEPKVEVKVTQKSSNEVTITPLQTLEAGEIYQFAIPTQKDNSIQKTFHFAYQVSEDLRITGTLPAKESTYVPINTGIEVNFNVRGIDPTDFQKFFSIEPKVEGKFEVKGKVAVFIPKQQLEQGKIYTVTVKKDMPLKGTSKTIKEDYTFQFETSQEERKVTSLQFTNEAYEWTDTDAPVLQAYFTEEGREYEPNKEEVVSLKVFQYENGRDFIASWEEKERVAPYWAYETRRNYQAPEENLKKVLEKDNAKLIIQNYQGFVFLPDKLPKGYYMVEIKKNDAIAQTFLQITNTLTYINISSNKTLLWINNLTSKKPVEGAKLEIVGTDKKTETDSKGTAIFENPTSLLKRDVNNILFIKVTTGDFDSYYRVNFYYSGDNIQEKYWSFIQTDRETYHPNDTVQYFGFLQGRNKNLEKKARVAVTDGYYFIKALDIFDHKNREHLYYTQEINISDGRMFEGKIDIKKMVPGYYQILIISDDKVITQIGFQVEDYIKPAYQLTSTVENDSLFMGEKTKIDIDAKFFEGTPVSNLHLEVNQLSLNIVEEKNTDQKGQTSSTFEAKKEGFVCGDKGWCSLIENNIVETRPLKEEEGDIYGSSNIKVIRSRVAAVNTKAKFNEISFETKTVDREKVRSGIYYWQPENITSGIAPQTKIKIAIDRIDEVKRESGEYYDYIDKVVRKAYSYETVYVPIKTVNLSSDENGKFFFNSELNKDENYQIEITIYDQEGNFYRDIRNIGKRYSYGRGEDYYTFSGIEYGDLFNIGDPVNLEIAKNGVEPVPSDGSYTYLFMTSKEGLSDFETTTSPKKSFSFDAKMIPNIAINALVFDGKSYKGVNMEFIRFNYEKRRLNIEMKSDKEKYQPGENVKLDIQVTNGETKEKVASDVSLYLVDEAYYAIYAERLNDPLITLYGTVSTGIEYAYSSHQKAVPMLDGRGGCFIAGTEILLSNGKTKNIEDIREGDIILTRKNARNKELVPGHVDKTYEHTVNGYLLINETLGVTPEHIIFLNGKWDTASSAKLGDILINDKGEKVVIESITEVKKTVKVYNFEVRNYHTYFANNIYVHNDKGESRQDFQDTALFKVVQTDITGGASIEFKVPDNITSWRVSAKAIRGGEEIMAGYGNAKIPVTKEVFVLPVLSTQYLTEDKPEIPIRVYGDGIQEKEALKIGVEVPSINYKEEKDGVSYDPTYFTLSNLSKGQHKVTSYVRRESTKEGEFDDSVILPMKVSESRLTKENIWSDILKESTVLKGSENERTKVRFMNNEVGPLYEVLLEAGYDFGDRADQKVANFLAKKWLSQYFEEDLAEEDFPTFMYQGQGIRLLPYDDEKLTLTAKLVNLDKSLWDENKILAYLRQNFESPDTNLSEKIIAIYGLSALGEPVLNELKYLVDTSKLSLEDKIYAALAFTNFGAQDLSADIFIDIMNTSTQKVGDFDLKVTFENALPNDELSLTALTTILADKLQSDKRGMLWNFVIKHEELEIYDLAIIEKMLYIKHRLEEGTLNEVSWKINGKEIKIKNNEIYSLSLLPQELGKTRFSDIKGEIKVFTYFENPLDLNTIKVDPRVKVTKWFEVNNQKTSVLHPGDFVKVHLKVNVNLDKKDLVHLTDYMPSGLLSTTRRRNFFEDGGNNNETVIYPYLETRGKLDFTVGCPIVFDETSNEETTASETIVSLDKASDSNQDKQKCIVDEEYYYSARVINKGEFVVEPTVIQSFENPSIINVSGGREKIKIEGEMQVESDTAKNPENIPVINTTEEQLFIQ